MSDCSPFDACPTPSGLHASDVPNNPGETLLQGAPNVIPPGFSQHLAEFVRISLLGRRDGKTYIEEFAGATGYHIRTIPAYRRYVNPVGIGAGAGLMVVVDRFGAGDILRVTDPQANAPDAAFDADGFPVDSFDWGNVADTLQIDIQQVVETANLPTIGTFIRGLTILPRGFLIALLDGGFLVWDVINQYAQNCKVYTLPEPFTGFTFNGNPGQYDQRRESGVYYFVAPANSPEGASCLLLIDYLQGTVGYALPGKDSPVIGGSLCGEVASIWTAEDGTNCDLVTRLQFADLSYFGSGAMSHKTLPDPSEASVSTTFDVLDGGTSPEFLDYVNRGPGQQDYASTEESTASGGAGRPLDASTPLSTLNRGRTSVAGVVTSSLPSSQSIRLNAKLVTTDPADLVRRVAYLHNSVAEMNAITSSNADVLLPLYVLIHGTNFDYLSDGGFVYGCTLPPDETHPNGSVTPVNDALVPFDIAIDRSSEPGRLKEPPDAKFALVDITTGLCLPEDPVKSLGFNMFAGAYAYLKTVLQEDEGFTRANSTPCTDEFWAQMEAVDGLHRSFADTENTPMPLASQVQPHVIEFPTPITAPGTDQVAPLDMPWSCFQPRIVPPIRLMAGPAESVWSRKDSFGVYNDGWINTNQRVDPSVALNTASQMHYPPVSASTNTPSFVSTCQAGFFALNWQKQRLDGPPVTFETPASISETLVGPLDPTPAQEDALVPEDVGLPLTGGIPAFLQPGSGLTPYEDLQRVVGFDTNIRSWIGLEVKLERTGVITDGKADWIQSSALENGLGVPVGTGLYPATSEAIICSDADNPLGASPGNAYDYGDTAADGASGSWEIDVFFDGVPAKTVATRVTFSEQIEYLAPTEAQNLLNATFLAEGASLLGYHKGRVYFSPNIVKTVTVKARLVNYAYQVFRIGWHSINFSHSDFFGGSLLCPGIDPGFFAGANCQASCCGNVACLSQVLFGNKLFSSDTVRPVVTNVLWEGEATYTIPDENNPYLALGMQVGYLMDVYMEFNLNGAMSAWNINLRTGSNGRTPQGTGL